MVNIYIRCEDISHFTLFEFTSKIEKNEKWFFSNLGTKTTHILVATQRKDC